MVYEIEALKSAGWIRVTVGFWKHPNVTWYSEGETETPLDTDGLPLLTTAQAVMIEVHDRPLEALCDGPQAISPEEIVRLMKSFREMAPSLQVEIL